MGKNVEFDDEEDEDAGGGHNEADEDEEEEEGEGQKLQRSVFYWITDEVDEDGKKKDPGAEHRTIYAEEVARKGVPLGILHNFIMEEIGEAQAFLSLPLTLVLVISYAAMVMGHVNPAIVRAVQDSIEIDIEDNANFAFDGHLGFMGHKDINDVNSLTDFWSWMNMGFIPLMFIFEHGWGQHILEFNHTKEGGLAPSLPFVGEEDFKRGMHLYYNRLVGGFRMVQERSTNDELGCTTNEKLVQFYGVDCVGGKGYELDPEMMTARLTPNPEKEVWAYVNDDIEKTMANVLDWEVSGWLDAKTSKIEISIAVYNAEYGLHSLVTVNFFFSRGGHIWKKIIPLSTYANWTDRKMLILIDFIWIMSMFAVWIQEIQEMITAVRQFGVKGLYSEYLNFWNVIDWASIMASLLVLSMFYGAIVMTNVCNDELEILGEMVRGTAEYNEQVKVYFDALHTCVHYVHKLALLMSGYPLIIVVRLLKAFHSQPRLAAVTRTLEVASVELIHFLIIFMLVFASFAVSGCVLFGRAVDGFATVPRSINSCFLLLLGDIDWDSIKVVGRREAQMWLGSFIIINCLLMMNMLLAIVMDAYSEVKGDMGAAETLVEEGMQVFRRWMGARRGELVPLSKILNAIEKEREVREKARRIEIDDNDEDEERSEDSFDMDFVIVPADMLMDWLERSNRGGRHWTMNEEQALEILQAAAMQYYEEHCGSATKNEVIMHMRKVDHRTQKIKADIDKELDKHGDDEEEEDEEDEEDKPKKPEDEGPEDPFEVPPDEEDDDKPAKVTTQNVATWLTEELPRFMQEIKADRLKSARQLTQLHAEIDQLRALVAVSKRCGEASTGLPPWHGGLWQGVGGVQKPDRGSLLASQTDADNASGTFGLLPQPPQQVAAFTQPNFGASQTTGTRRSVSRLSSFGPNGMGQPKQDRLFSSEDDRDLDEEEESADVGFETRTFEEEPVARPPGGGLRVTGVPVRKRINEGFVNGMEDNDNFVNGDNPMMGMGDDEVYPEDELGDSDPELGLDLDNEVDPRDREFPMNPPSRDVAGGLNGFGEMMGRSDDAGKGLGKGGRGKGSKNPRDFRSFREAQQELRKMVSKKSI